MFQWTQLSGWSAWPARGGWVGWALSGVEQANNSLQLFEGQLQRWWSKACLGSDRWYNKTKDLFWAWEVYNEHNEKLLHWEGSVALAKVVQRNHEISPHKSFQKLGGWTSICLSLLCLNVQGKGYVEASCPLIVLYSHLVFLFFLGVCGYRCEISEFSGDALTCPRSNFLLLMTVPPMCREREGKRKSQSCHFKQECFVQHWYP